MNTIKEKCIKLYAFIFKLFGIVLPKCDRVIIFESFLGKQFSDNPRAIYEYIKEHYPEYKLYWSVERKSIQKFKKYNVKFVKRFSFRWLVLMNCSKYWITNSRLPLWIPKSRRTIYVQTWHGTPLKKLGIDIEEVQMAETTTEKYKREFILESSKWDYLISPNAYSTGIFKRAFNFNKTIIESGYPRNDYLINNNNKTEVNKIKQKLGLPKDKKIILYAPTWRDNQFYSKGHYKFNLNLDLDLLNEKLSNDFILLFRMHYLISENLTLSGYDGFIFDLSDHEDIRELYLIADILITDYSSAFFDYSILERPIIFYVYDIDEYRNNIRGFYINFEDEVPGPIVNNTKQLIETIRTIDMERNLFEKIVNFKHKYCYLEDGNSSKRVVKTIFNIQ